MSAEGTLTHKCVVVCGLLHKKTCLCDKCKRSGACISIPDALRDLILAKFHEQIRNDRLEKLGTYAQDFGDNKIVRKGDDTVFVRSVVVKGEHFSVAYKLVPVGPLRVASDNGHGDSCKSLVDNANDARLMRQMSQG